MPSQRRETELMADMIDARPSMQPQKSTGSNGEYGRPPSAPPSRAPPTCPQKTFLHRTLKAISLELTEAHEEAREVVRPRGQQTKAYFERRALRSAFADHQQAEVLQLRRQLALRKRAVEDVRAELDEKVRRMAAMQRYAERKRREAEMQKEIERENRKAGKNVSKLLSSATQKSRSGGQQLPQSPTSNAAAVGGAGGSPSDPTGPGGVAKPPTLEELAHRIQERAALIQELRDELRDVEQETQHDQRGRKYQESELFASELKVLRLRSEAREAEEKVKRLSNELKACYKRVPEVLSVRLVQPDVCARNEQLSEAQVTMLRNEHNAFHFKFLGTEQLDVEEQLCKARTDHLRKFIQVGEEQTKVNHKIFEHLLHRVNESAGEMVVYMNLIWEKLRKEVDTQTRLKGALTGLNNGDEVGDACAFSAWLEHFPVADDALERIGQTVIEIEGQLSTRLGREKKEEKSMQEQQPAPLSPLSRPPHEQSKQPVRELVEVWTPSASHGSSIEATRAALARSVGPVGQGQGQALEELGVEIAKPIVVGGSEEAGVERGEIGDRISTTAEVPARAPPGSPRGSGSPRGAGETAEEFSASPEGANDFPLGEDETSAVVASPQGAVSQDGGAGGAGGAGAAGEPFSPGYPAGEGSDPDLSLEVALVPADSSSFRFQDSDDPAAVSVPDEGGLSASSDQQDGEKDQPQTGKVAAEEEQAAEAPS